MELSDVGYRQLLPELFSVYTDAMPVRFKAEVKPVLHVVHAWFLRCQRGIEAVMRLDAGGYVVESAPLRRSVLEHVIALAWLVENPGVGWKVLVRGGLQEGTKRKESIERAGWTSVDLAAFDEVIADAEAIDSSADNQLHFRQRCEAVGTPQDWASYLIETSQSHPGWQSAVPYLKLNHDTGEVRFRSRPFDDMNLGQWATIYQFQALMAINAALEGEPLAGRLADIQGRMIPLLIQAREERGLLIPEELLRANTSGGTHAVANPEVHTDDMSDDFRGPCRTCGSADVRTRSQATERSLADTGSSTLQIRVCGNRSCPTNNPRDKGLTDIV